MRVAITGGRKIITDIVAPYMDLVHTKIGITVLIEGEAIGIDKAGKAWAESCGVPVLAFPIRPEDWRLYGLSAGPRRNQKMIDIGKPDILVAFPGGRGTGDMVRRSRAAGLRIIEYPNPP